MSQTPRLVLRLLRRRTDLGRGLLGHPQTQQTSSDVVFRVGAARGLSSMMTDRVSTVMTERDHTSKWMSNYENKSPQELIADVPPIVVGARVVACEGGRDPSLGHPIEYICLDLDDPAVCKYCGLRYVQAHHH